jgi:hypothetical protein
LSSLTKKINETISQAKNLKTLVISNTIERRYIIPVAYYVDKSADIMLLQKPVAMEELLRELKSIPYTKVMFLNLYMIDNMKDNFSLSQEDTLVEHLTGKGYIHADQLLYGHFRKNSDPQLSEQEYGTLDIYSKE